MINENLNLFSVSGLLILFTFPILTVLSLKNYKSKLHTIWAVFNIAVGVWGLGAFLVSIANDAKTAFIYWKIAHVGIIFIPILYFHVSYVFCDLTNKKILVFLYLQAVFFLLLNIFDKLFQDNMRYVFSSFYYFEPTIYYYIFFTSWIITALAGTLNYVFAYNRVVGVKKVQIKYFIFATIFGFSGGLMNFLPVFHLDIFPYGNFLLPIFPIIVTYAILRYRLMDIYLAIKRTAAYSLSAGLLTGLFVVLVLTVTNFLSTFANVSSFRISIFAAVLIALLFNPLRNWIQNLIDKIFYKKSYDYYSIVQQVSSTLASMFDLEKIFPYIGNVVYEAMGIKNVYLLSGVSGGSFDIVYHTSIKKDKNIKKKTEPGKTEEIRVNKFSGIVKFFKTSHDILIKDELANYEELLGQEAIDSIKRDLEVFHGEVVVPVFIDKKLTLLLVLGEKISGDIFTNEDINLLNTISIQAAIAVKNAKLYQEKVHSERLASIGMMSATFAHEIRNPLTSLKTFAQLMPEKYNDIEFRDTFSRIVVGEIEKIDGLISDLLDFSSNKKPTRVNNINLVELVDKIVDYVKGKLEFEKSKIVVEKNYNGSVIQVSGDAGKLKQAFSNIIINGCQAMNDEGMLRINIKPNDKNVDVIVEDTGEGIPPEDLSKIFDPFITTKERGIGLGLAISKRVIEDHNGKIHVKSQLARGTTFTVTLPVQNE
jgi:two-component system NtrC family sensor kinase